MGMPAETTPWTAEMARALPEDGNRHEVLDGELFVTRAPTWDHQRLVGALHRRLFEYLAPHRVADVLMAPADIEFSHHRLLEPDLFVVPLVDGRKPVDWAAVRRLLLVVEVLSPSTVRADRFHKREIYQDERVPEYWIVHPEGRLVERWRPESEQPEVVDGVLTWQPVPALAAFSLDLPEFFAEVFDDGPV